jgi:hypothetical protein
MSFKCAALQALTAALYGIRGVRGVEIGSSCIKA